MGERPTTATRYLEGLPDAQRDELHRVNAQGLKEFGGMLGGDRTVAFLGAGASAPLFPLWGGLINNLADQCAHAMTDEQLSTCRKLASTSPDAAVQILRQSVNPADFHEILRQAFGPRRHPETGRTWTPIQELVTRCALAGVITTNYDAGIVNARMAVRRNAQGTGFSSWDDDALMDRWQSLDVFGDDELPVLYAHGQHNQPGNIVLATSEYREAYRGKLRDVLRAIFEAGHVVWIGFSFVDQRIAEILNLVQERSGTLASPGRAPRHVAILPWDPDAEANDPNILRAMVELQFGARPIFYPHFGPDHSALERLLADHADPRYQAPVALETEPSASAGTTTEIASSWAPGIEAASHFTGRGEELDRLDRWARDPEVRLIGVVAWGGAGKTSLVSHWLTAAGGDAARADTVGIFAWSFYDEPSGDDWAVALVDWVSERFGHVADERPLDQQVAEVLSRYPLVLLLDGLEVIQEPLSTAQYGRLQDTRLRGILRASCHGDHRSLLVLTSRSPFPDLELYDGVTVRMLNVPPLSVAEGSRLLERAGVAWLAREERAELVHAVDGHALAVVALGGVLADRAVRPSIKGILGELQSASRTDERVAQVLVYYAEQLSPVDRHLVGVVSYFTRPQPIGEVLKAVSAKAFPGHQWSERSIEVAVRQRLSGLLSWHGNRTISAHPLVRESFRSYAASPETVRRVTSLVLAGVPKGQISNAPDALHLVEIVEVLVAAGEWQSADDLYRARTNNGYAWLRLPAAQLGARCARAFVGAGLAGTCRQELSGARADFYLNELALFSTLTGDVEEAEQILLELIDRWAGAGDQEAGAAALRNLATTRSLLGDTEGAEQAAADAMTIARASQAIRPNAYAVLARAYDLDGQTLEADRMYARAEAAAMASISEPGHLYSLPAVHWADFLLRTGRTGAARTLANDNLERSMVHGRSQDVARSRAILGRCEAAAGQLDAAVIEISAAADVLEHGELTADWIDVMVHLATCRRRRGELDEAIRLCDSAIKLAGPRKLVPLHGHALAERAMGRAAMAGTAGEAALARAKDDAEHALRLGTLVRRLPWMDLAAYEALARVAEVEEGTHGDGEPRSRRDRRPSPASLFAEDLRRRLLPDGIEDHPLAASQPSAWSVAEFAALHVI